ncbi:hypothetical protein ABPG74_003421 [Tetrahymena malaccensis]
MRRKRILIDDDDQREEKLSAFDEFKQKVYYTFSEILECKQISPTLAIFMIVFSYLQVISLTCNSYNVYLNNSLFGLILPLIGYTLLFPQITSQQNLFFNYGLLILGLGISIFIIWGMYYVYKCPNQEEVYIRQFKSSLGLIYDAFDKIIFIPLMGLILANFFCQLNVTCFSTTHIILIIFSVITFFLMIILEILYNFMFFNFTFKSQDSFSRNPSDLNMTSIVFKLVSLLTYLILNLSDHTQLLEQMLVMIIISFFIMLDTLNSYPYHLKSVSKTNCIMVTTFFWVNASSFFVEASNIQLFQQNALLLVGLGAVFFVKLQLNRVSYTANNVMISELIAIDTDILLDMKVRVYHTLSQNLHIKKSELLLASLLKIHHDKCVDPMCPCQRRNYLYDPKNLGYGDSKIQFHKDDVFVKHFVNKMIKDGLKKFRTSKIANLDHLFYQFEFLCLYTPLYTQSHQFRKMYGDNLGASIDFILYCLQQKIYKYIYYKNIKNPVSESLQIENVKEFDKGLKQIRESIRDVSQHFSDLWETLIDQVPDLSKLLQVCNKNFQEIKQTQDIFQDLTLLNNTSIELKVLMEIYANQIVFDELLQLQVQKSIHMRSQLEVGNSVNQDLDFLIKKYNIYDDNICVISLSSRYETMSQITWCSHNVDQILGVNSFSLKGRSINDFMPTVFSSFHDQILKHFYNTGQETTINNIMHTWALDQQGYLFSANVFAKIIPLQKEIEIMSLIHKLNNTDYILTDSDGEISGFGKKFANILNITPKEFSKFRLNIQLIAPKLMSVYRDYFVDLEEGQQTQRPIQNTKKMTVLGSDIQSSVKEVKFIIFIPQNFTEVLQDHQEKKNELFSTFFNLEEDILRQKSKMDPKILFEFKSIYFNYIQYGLRKINWKKLQSIIKMRATIQTFTFYNGHNMQSVKALKIMHYEVKKPDYDYMQKMKKRQEDLKGVITEMNKMIDDQKKKKFKSQVFNEQKILFAYFNLIFFIQNEEEQIALEIKEKADDGVQDKRKQQYKKRLKNVLSLFQRSGSAQFTNLGSLQPADAKQDSKVSTPQNSTKIQTPQNKQQKSSGQPGQHNNNNEERIDVEVKKAIIGLLRPATQNNYAQAVIRQARLSQMAQIQGLKKDDKRRQNFSYRKQTSNQLSESSPKSNQQLFSNQASRIEDFSNQGSVISKEQDKQGQKLAVTAPPDRKAKKNMFIKKNVVENFYPEFDEELHLPVASKFKQILINKRIIGKKKGSHFYQHQGKSKRRESGLMFDFDEAQNTQYSQTNAATMTENEININLIDQEDDNKQEDKNQDQVNENNLNTSLSQSKIQGFEKQRSRIKSSEGDKSPVYKDTKEIKNLINQNDYKRQRSGSKIVPQQEKNTNGRKLSKMGLFQKQGSQSNGFNKLRNKMKNGQLIKQLKSFDREKDGSPSNQGNLQNADQQKQVQKSDSSSEEDVNAEELKILLKSEKSNHTDKEERNLIENLEKRDIQDEEKAVAQSVNSTNSSINTQNALRLLRVSLQNMKLPFVLIIANYCVITMSILVFALSLTQLITTQSSYSDIKQQVNILDNISAYSENTTQFYYFYKDLYFVENKYLDNSLYDQNWWSNQQNLISNASLNFFNFTVNDLSQAGGQEIQSKDVRFYLFEQMDAIMLIDQDPIKLNIDFQKYIRLFMNAVNSTITYTRNKFDKLAISKDDFLYFIFSNYDLNNQQNQFNFSEAMDLIHKSMNQLFSTFISLWTFTFTLIAGCVLAIYPIILKSRIKIHDSLVLFTKISIRDVENYYTHYKNITHFFSTFISIRQLSRDVESFLEGEQILQFRQRKENDNKSISRSRKYKGVKIDRMGFFMQMLVVYVFFTAFAILKDIKMIFFITNTEDYIKAQINQQQVFYQFQNRVISYKQYLSDFQDQENQSQIEIDSNNLSNQMKGNITKLLMDNYQLFGKIDQSYTQFVNSLMTDPVCQILALPSNDLCYSLQNSLLSKSFQNFFIYSENLFLNGFEHVKSIYQQQGFQKAQIESIMQINDTYLKDLTSLQQYIQLVNLMWKEYEQSSLFDEIDQQLQFTQIVFICYSVSIFLFLVFVWLNVYLNLKRDSRWVNGFILLIPIQMLRENQYLRSYLKRKLQINSLSYA